MKNIKSNNDNPRTDYFSITSKNKHTGYVFNKEEDYTKLLLQVEKVVLFSNDSSQVIAYCMAPDHFSFLISQDKSDAKAVNKFLHSLVNACNMTSDKNSQFSYEDYDVRKISKAELVDISRNLHTCQENWIDYPHSSLRSYLYDDSPIWLDKTPIISVFGSAKDYINYILG